MKKMRFIIAIFLFVLVISIIFYFFYKFTIYQNEKDRIKLEGIENFPPEELNENGSYFLVYPADNRVSQGYTLIKEVLKSGEVVQEYEILDEDFRRASVYQKPNELNQLYISLFGEPVIQNWFYKYDIDRKKFNKMDIDYFNYDVGVGHFKHYGKDVLFETLVSHKTGTQNYDEESGDFNLSISNYSTKESWETIPGYEPTSEAILQFGDKIMYAVSGTVDDDGIPINPSIAIIDTNIGETQFMQFDDNENGWEYYPFFVTNEYAYILGEQGALYVLDQELNVKTYSPFQGLSDQDYYYDMDTNLLLDDTTALHMLYQENNGKTIPTLGLFSFDKEPTFTILENDYIRENYHYKFLYQDINNNEIYMVGIDENSDHLLVIHNETFKLIHDIPVKFGHLLDMVIKN